MEEHCLVEETFFILWPQSQLSLSLSLKVGLGGHAQAPEFIDHKNKVALVF